MHSFRTWVSWGTLLILGIAPITRGSVLFYSELFPNGTTNTNLTFAGIGWEAYSGATATAQHTTDTNWPLSYNPGKDGARGYGAKTSTGSIGFTFTPEATLTSLQRAALESVSFYSNNSNTTDFLYVAVRVDANGTPGSPADDAWFATTAGFKRESATAGNGTSGGNFPTNGELESFTWTESASAWRSLAFTAGVELAAGATLSSNLPGGDITAMGLFMTNNAGAGNGSVLRFDDFAVTLVPEPGTVALLGALVLPLLARRRR